MSISITLKRLALLVALVGSGCLFGCKAPKPAPVSSTLADDAVPAAGKVLLSSCEYSPADNAMTGMCVVVSSTGLADKGNGEDCTFKVCKVGKTLATCVKGDALRSRVETWTCGGKCAGQA